MNQVSVKIPSIPIKRVIKQGYFKYLANFVRTKKNH